MKAHQEGEIRNFSCKPISDELREEVNEAAAVPLPRHYRVIKDWRGFILDGGLERRLSGDLFAIPYSKVTDTECGFSEAPGLKNTSINGCGIQAVRLDVHGVKQVLCITRERGMVFLRM